MEQNIEKLFSDYSKLLDTQAFVESDLDYSILNNHIPYLEKIESLSNSAIMVFDLFKRKHVYVSKNIAGMLKLNKEKVDNVVDYMDKRIHPEDFPQLLEAGHYFLHYAFSLPHEKRTNGKLINEYRILNEENNYVRIIEQQMALEMDVHGNVWLALGIIDISPDQNHDAPFRSRLVNTDTGQIFHFPPIDKESMLSVREKEILKLIAKGLISRQIADKLYISVNTVNTHRQKILEKLSADSTIDAINYASKHGLLA